MERRNTFEPIDEIAAIRPGGFDFNNPEHCRVYTQVVAALSYCKDTMALVELRNRSSGTDYASIRNSFNTDYED